MLRSLGATSDGGYTVAWGSLQMQHYDGAGEKDGAETLIAFSLPVGTEEDPSQVLSRNASVAVLADGGAVVLYGTIDVFMQRFDASGTRVLSETAVARHSTECGGRCSFVFVPKQVHALADGGFLLEYLRGSTLGGITVFLRRYDSQGQPVGGAVTTEFESSDPQEVGRSYRVTADANGGFLVQVLQRSPDLPSERTIAVTHYDAVMGVQASFEQPLTPTQSATAPSLLLPLGGGYALFVHDATADVRLMLDTAGNPTGDAVPIPAFPVEARELSDGSFVVIWKDATGFTAQRFTAAGALLGQPVAIDIGVSSFLMASLLTEPGFALAWTAQGNVYTQRFVESGQTARKACLDAAKLLQLKGHERKAFIDACMELAARDVPIGSRARALLQSIREHLRPRPAATS